MRVTRKTVTAFIFLFLGLSACNRRPPIIILPPPAPAPVAVPAPEPEPAPPPAPPEPEPAPSPAARTLDEAGKAFAEGAHPESVAYYQTYLRLAPDGEHRDLALFRLGLVYASPDYMGHNWQLATAHFKRIASDHPDSPFRPAVELILSTIVGLREEIAQSQMRGSQLAATIRQQAETIRQLSTELERLRQIDADRLRRP